MHDISAGDFGAGHTWNVCTPGVVLGWTGIAEALVSPTPSPLAARAPAASPDMIQLRFTRPPDCVD
jgi:hypothetical protein